MDLKGLEKENDYCWSVIKKAGESRAPIRLFGSENIIRGMDDKVLDQITGVAQLPGLVGAAMTMPDAHWGYGFPIGGVAAFDAEAGGIISAGGVGFDISCGVRCLRTDCVWDEIKSVQESLADELYRVIPAGVGIEGRLKFNANELDIIMLHGAKWAVQEGFGSAEDLLYIEEQGQMSGAQPRNVSEHAKHRQAGEMGTLGSGNHYLEVQVVDKIFDEKAADAFGLFENQVLISIHCGSRGLGHQIGTDYLILLAKAAKRLGITFPDRELACAPIKSPEGQLYLGAMRAGVNCALANRQILTHLTREAFHSIDSNTKIETLYDVSHNTCKAEKHQVGSSKKLLYVHRKGATRAFGADQKNLPAVYQHVGQPVIIGGSMGTGSYILAGNLSTENQAYSSASHGAGRSMSRHQALKHWRGSALVSDLAHQGIFIRSRSMRGIAEEAPLAYKDVDEVALSTEKAKLARRVAYLKPKICVKG